MTYDDYGNNQKSTKAFRVMPHSLPEDYSPGEESEAVFYSKDNLEAWKITPGALDWLLHQTK